MSEAELKSQVIPLCQYKIVQKNPQGKDFKMDDKFRVNFQYYNNSIKIKVPVMHSKAARANEIADLNNRVEDDRKHMIEATIVKVMKSRRRINH